MNLSHVLGLWAVAILVLTNGFFVATEFAIVSVRRSKLEEAARIGSAAAESALEVVRHMDAYLAACQVGITMASLALGWIGEPALAHLIEPPFEAVVDEVAPTLSHTIAIGISFALITTLHIVVGEQAAKGLALQKTEGTTLFVAPIMRLLYKLLKWPILFLNLLCNALLGLFGMHSAWGEQAAHSIDELRLLVASSRDAGLVEASDARIATRAFQFSDITAGSIMTPRTELEAIPLSLSPDEVIRTAQTSIHTRLLVYNGSLEDIIGVIHIHDVVRVQSISPRFSLENILRPVLFVPEGKAIDDLLDEMRTTRRHVAVVVEEFGGTAGIVTLRDIIGGLVGRIESEQTPYEGIVYTPPESDGFTLLDGLTRIQDFEETTGIHLNGAMEGKAETLGGLVMALMGRIALPGDCVELNGRILEVKEMDNMRVARVRIHPPPADESLNSEEGLTKSNSN
jgi:CBS domain containing-hemolysin-like protein